MTPSTSTSPTLPAAANSTPAAAGNGDGAMMFKCEARFVFPPSLVNVR
jgi:hypothetical protein